METDGKWQWSEDLRNETTRVLLEVYGEATLLSHMLNIPGQVKPPMLLVSASEFAQFMKKSRQTIHLWAQTGFLIQLGYQINFDVTRHLSIGIPPTHEQYQEFLAWRSKR